MSGAVTSSGDRKEKPIKEKGHLSMIFIETHKRMGYVVLGLAAGLTALTISDAKAELVYGISDQLDQLVSFDSSTPGTLRSAITLNGLQSGEQIRAIDWVNGVLYGLGDASHLYTINTTTGAAVPVGSGSFSPILNGIDFGLTTSGAGTFNVSSDLGQNLTLNQNTGTAAVQPNYSGTLLNSLAYNYVTGTFIGVSTLTHDLYNVNPATGLSTLIGSSDVDFADHVGLDVSSITGDAYFSGTVNGQTEFFTVNASTGIFSLVGNIGVPGELNGGLNSITAAGPITTVPEPASTALLVVGGGFAGILLRRKK